MRGGWGVGRMNRGGMRGVRGESAKGRGAGAAGAGRMNGWLGGIRFQAGSRGVCAGGVEVI